MQKMSPVASKLSELWQFMYTKVTWNLNFTIFWNLKISLNFRDRSPKFCMWSLNLYLSNMSIATWGLSQLHNWFLRGGFRSPPPLTHRICTPSEVGLFLFLNFFGFTVTLTLTFTSGSLRKSFRSLKICDFKTQKMENKNTKKKTKKFKLESKSLIH